MNLLQCFVDLLTGFSLGWNHYKAMFIKRFLNSLREKKAIVSQILLPLLVTICGLALGKVTPTQTENPALILDLAQQGTSKLSISSFVADFRQFPDANFVNVS